ncbi:pantoate--beta-alanine ligase [Candidatus Calescamantes bacterium]|nr:pantoate--beta-alanine ligase [Candidatus Calescamantes bacterium]
MEVIGNLQLMQERSLALRKEGKIIGFVPTMGYLHEGHLSLIRKAREETEVVVVSIYVNPTQFGPGEDFDRYPRDLERDRSILENERVDILFAPSDKDMYPPDFSTYVEETKISQRWEGERRPGHFRGVTTIVAKLFNIVLPHRAYFGEKDWQQAKIIKRMVRDLNFPVEIIVLPTVREKDGLACSSRNTYLSPQAREKATSIYKTLKKGEEWLRKGWGHKEILEKMKKELEEIPGLELEYLVLVDPDTLEPLQNIQKENLFLIACRVDGVRLIDNLCVKLEK